MPRLAPARTINVVARWAWLIAAVAALAALTYIVLQLNGVASSERAQRDIREDLTEIALNVVRTAAEANESGDSAQLEASLASSAPQVEALIDDTRDMVGGDRGREAIDRVTARFAEFNEAALAFARGEAPRQRLDTALLLLARDADALRAIVTESDVDQVDRLGVLLAGAVAAGGLALVGGVGGLSLYRRRQAARYTHVSDALSGSEARLRLAHVAAVLGDWEYDLVRGKGWWSDERYRILGLEPGSVEPSLEAHLQLVHPDDRDLVTAHARATAAGRDSERPFVYRIIRPEGVVRTLEVRHAFARDEDGRLLRVFGTTLDITERVNAERALRESEESLARSQRLAHLGSWEWDAATDRLTWSDEMYRILGLEPGAEAKNETFLSAVHPDDRERMQADLDRAHVDDGRDEADYRIVRPDGAERIVRTERQAQRDETGRLIRIVGFVQDVTERVAAERALRESEERARRIVETARDAFIAIDADGTVTEWNPQAADTFGWSRSEAVGRRLKELVFPERHRDDHERGLRHFLATGQGPVLNSRIEIDALHRDGHEFPVELSIWPLAVDGTHVFNAFIRDITERKRAERALREGEENLRMAQEITNVGSAVFHPKTGELTWSDHFYRILGVEPQSFEPTSERFYEFVHPEDRDALRHAFAELPTTPEAAYSQFRIVRPDGAERVVERQATRAELSAEGAVERVFAAFRDVTERRALEQQLLQAQKSEALGTLVAGVAHDFNNLLTAIGGGIYLASRRPDQSERWLRSAEDAVVRASGVVRQLLQFSRREEPQRTTVDLVELARETVQLAVETFDRRVAVQVEAGSPPAVWADRGQLELVLMNLLMNARDAVISRADEVPSASGYRPRITVTIDEAPRAQDEGGGNWVELAVSDNGVGMDRETRERIFDPFFTAKPAGRGTGLGLSTAYGIIGEHDGAITVESEPGQGATFRVRLTAAAPADVADEASAGTAAGPDLPRATRGPSVLLVDDEEALLEFAAEVLSEAGYRVTAATDGEAALRCLDDAEFDLMVLDVNMPTLSGWQTMERMAEGRARPSVLVISGYGSESEAVARGARGFLGKPFDARALLEAAEAALGTPSLRS